MRNSFERRFEYVRKKSVKQNISRALEELNEFTYVTIDPSTMKFDRVKE